MITLININGIDYTSNVVIDSYAVNASKVYSEWTDANGTAHRQMIREKVTGEFKLAFANDVDYSQFIDHIKSNEALTGYIPTYLFVNNRNEYRSCNLFFDFETSAIKAGSGDKYIIPFKVKITER